MAQMYGQGWKKSYAPFRDRHSIPDHSGKRPYEGNDFKPGDIADMLGDLMNQGATYRHRAQYTDDFAYRVASKMWLKVKNRSQNKITLADLFNGKVPKYICRNMPRIAITQNLNQKEAFELIERLYKVLYSGSTNPASETPRFELKKKGRVPGKEYEKKKENVNATEPLSRGLESTIAEIYSAYSNISLHAQSTFRERLPEGLKRIEQSMGHHGLEAFFRLCGYERIPGYLNQIVEKNRNLYLDKYLYTSFSILNNSISKQEKL